MNNTENCVMEENVQGFRMRKVHPTFGLEIQGLDVSEKLDAATVVRLTELSAQHKLLIFKGQSLSDYTLNVFAQHFGDTNQVPPSSEKEADPTTRRHNVSRLGNVEKGEGVPGQPTGYGALARFWHTDSSWRAVPTWLSFLTAAVLPSKGGQTCFADMEAAYQALPASRRDMIERKQMIHSWDTLSLYEPTAVSTVHETPPPAAHPIVRSVRGRKSLFLSGHAAYYVGNMPFDQGKALFDELLAHATSPEFVYEHQWEVGDLLVWDNRTTMHRVLPYDWAERRVMFRAEVLGTEPPM